MSDPELLSPNDVIRRALASNIGTAPVERVVTKTIFVEDKNGHKRQVDFIGQPSDSVDASSQPVEKVHFDGPPPPLPPEARPAWLDQPLEDFSPTTSRTSSKRYLKFLTSEGESI